MDFKYVRAILTFIVGLILSLVVVSLFEDTNLGVFVRWEQLYLVQLSNK